MVQEQFTNLEPQIVSSAKWVLGTNWCAEWPKSGRRLGGEQESEWEAVCRRCGKTWERRGGEGDWEGAQRGEIREQADAGSMGR